MSVKVNAPREWCGGDMRKLKNPNPIRRRVLSEREIDFTINNNLSDAACLLSYM